MCRGVFIHEVEVVKNEAMEENLHVFPDTIEEVEAEFNWSDFAAMTRVYDVVRGDHEIITTRLIMEDVASVIRECEERFRIL
ncbi:hypothetical protein DMENIID0001_169100 [Sergentomyia squamirostris]